MHQGRNRGQSRQKSRQQQDPWNEATYRRDSQDGKGGKAIAYLKLFTPDSGFTWWITEGSPTKDDLGTEVDFQFFGLVEGQFKELGYVCLSELESVNGPMGLPIERDLYWQPKTLEEIAPEMFSDNEASD